MKIQELREQSEVELLAKLEEVKSELFNLVNELKVTRKLEQPHLVKEKKKLRARILTLLNETKEERE